MESGKPEAGSPKPEVKKAPPPPEPQLQKAKKIVRKLKEQKPDRWRIVKNGAEVDYDDLPAHLQNAWDENRDRYKQIRSLHEKLKLMHKAEPEDRQPLVNEITRHDDRIRKNWAEIDAWQPGQEPEPAPGKPQVKMDHKRISANRKYITTGTKRLVKLEGEKAAALRQQIQGRVDELLAAGVEISEKKKKELRNYFINV